MSVQHRRRVRRIMRELAKDIVSQYADAAKADPAEGAIGLTVIVHKAAPAIGEWTHAVHSTLANAAQTRALLAEVLADSLIADGATEETAGAAAAADYLKVVGEPKDRPS